MCCILFCASGVVVGPLLTPPRTIYRSPSFYSLQNKSLASQKADVSGQAYVFRLQYYMFALYAHGLFFLNLYFAYFWNKQRIFHWKHNTRHTAVCAELGFKLKLRACVLFRVLINRRNTFYSGEKHTRAQYEKQRSPKDKVLAIFLRHFNLRRRKRFYKCQKFNFWHMLQTNDRDPWATKITIKAARNVIASDKQNLFTMLGNTPHQSNPSLLHTTVMNEAAVIDQGGENCT